MGVAYGEQVMLFRLQWYSQKYYISKPDINRETHTLGCYSKLWISVITRQFTVHLIFIVVRPLFFKK